MSDLTKQGVFTKRMSKRTSVESIVSSSTSVPRKFIETEGRKKFSKIVSVIELIAFVVTVVIVGIILLFMVFPKLLPENLADLEVSLVIIPLFLANMMGMFVSSASNGTGVNWCARGIAVMFFFLTAGLLLMHMLKGLLKLMF